MKTGFFSLALIAAAVSSPALAAETVDLGLPASGVAASQAPAESQDFLSAWFADWGARAARARASQPEWSSPVVTSTGLLEQRFRFDFSDQFAGNHTETKVLDNGKGLDLIVTDTNEIQFAAPAYDIRRTVNDKGHVTGFADWQFLRIKQRLASAPASEGDYILTAWVAVQAPTGVAALTSNAWTYVPTLAFGKGWGDFDIQGTIAGSLPASHVNTLGDQIQANIAFQLHYAQLFWPELEVNTTYWAGGQRDGLTQVFLTPGLVVGRFNLGDIHPTFGFGYQTAVSPDLRLKPLTPSYNHAWVFTSRFNF